METFLLLLGGYAALKVLGGKSSAPVSGKKVAPGGFTSITGTGTYYAPATSGDGKSIDELASEVVVTFGYNGLPEPWGTGNLATDRALLAACLKKYGPSSLEGVAVAMAVQLDQSASITKAQSDVYVSEARAAGRWCFTQLAASFDPTDPGNTEQSDGTWVVNGAWDDGGHDGYHDGMNVGRVTGIVDEPSNFWGDVATGLEDIGKGVAFAATFGQVNLFGGGLDPQGDGVAAGVQAGVQEGQDVESDVESGDAGAIANDIAKGAALV